MMPPKKDQPENPKQADSTSASTSRRSSHNPVIRYDSLSIDELSDDISSQIDKLIHEGKDYEDIFDFYIDKKGFTPEQSARWLEKYNKFRGEKGESSSHQESDPLGATSQSLSEEALDSFINDLCRNHKWLLDSQSEEGYESSDCSSGDEGPQKSQLPPKSAEVSKKFSWKEFKATKEFGKIFARKPKNPNVSHLLKLTVKELFKQKKKAKKLAKEKERGIEVDKEEVFDMVYSVTDHMAKKYIPRIKQVAPKLDPGLDVPGSECGSGSYDSEDNFYEHKEDKRSLLPKMALSLDPELLVKEGLYKVLLVTLPHCFDHTDQNQVFEFIEILKDAKERVIAEPSKPKAAPSPLKSFKEREGEPTKVKTHALVAPSLSNETLAGMTDIKDWGRESVSEDLMTVKEDVVEDAEISDRLSRRTLKSEGSEESTSFPYIDESTSASSDVVFPDTYKGERRATLASPEDLTDIQMSETPGTDQSQHSETPSELQRRGSRRRSPSMSQPGRSPAKRKH